MTDNGVIHGTVVVVHASSALLALTLGGAQLARRRYGDRLHRRVGRVWVAAMYATIASSFFITDLRPGEFTVFHALSVFTTCTLTAGLVAAVRGDVSLHLRMMTGSWLGVVGAFLGAVAVPSRAVPQLALHQPELHVAWVAAVAAATYLLVRGRVPSPVTGPRRPAAGRSTAPAPGARSSLRTPVTGSARAGRR